MNHEIEPDTPDIDSALLSIDSAQLSHELRTALTVAHGYAELIRRHLATPEPDLPRIAAMNEILVSQLLRLEATVRVTLDNHLYRPSDRHPDDRAPQIARQ